jgi:hypothetical protein
MDETEVLQTMREDIRFRRPNRTVLTFITGFFPVVRIGSPHPLTRKGVLFFPPVVPGRETRSLAGEGMGGPNSDEGTDTLALYICTLYYNPSTTYIIKGTLGICGV